LKLRTLLTTASRIVKNRGELKFAIIHLTTRCNAKCVDRCNIWASAPFDVKLEDAKFVVDMLAKNGFSVTYFTGGETGLYPQLVEVVKYAKTKGMITSITTNGTISKTTLLRLNGSLDVLSVSVDHYDENIWDETKHIAGISKKAKEIIEIAKASGIKLYAITFLNPSWTIKDIEKIIRYVNGELGVSFAISYPYVSTNDGTFTVGGNLHKSLHNSQANLRTLVSKVLQMKLFGFDVVTASAYLRDVLRAHEGLPMRFPCKAGKTIITIDCNLNVYPCYRKGKLFNVRKQELNVTTSDNSLCDNKYCLINCFKEASIISRGTFLKAVKEELLSNPKFYVKLII
jgi:MoaA/NifB/PqqE/SkfB family radical SAM enzyme